MAGPELVLTLTRFILYEIARRYEQVVTGRQSTCLVGMLSQYVSVNDCRVSITTGRVKRVVF